MADAFICDAVRTPIGRYGGGLAAVRTDDLGAVPIRALMVRNAAVVLHRKSDMALVTKKIAALSKAKGYELRIQDWREASGMIDFAAIFEAAYEQGMVDYYVEVEEYEGTPMEDVKQSFDFLDSAPYVK